MYTYGTSALKKEYYSTDSKKGAKVKKMPKVSSRRNVRLLKKRVIFAIALVFVMAFTVILRYAIIAQEYGKLTRAREELELVNAMVVEKQVVAAGNLDPKRIEQEAERLGLQQLSDRQIKYISLGNVDNGEVLKTESIGGMSAFINQLSGILGYLY